MRTECSNGRRKVASDKLPCWSSLCKKLLSALAATIAVGAGAETTTYSWNGTSPSYGDQVTVFYDAGGNVTHMSAALGRQDQVVFTGSAATFAANATIKLEGAGSIVFSNKVETAGDINLKGDVSNSLTIPGSEEFTVGKTIKFPIDGVRPGDIDITGAKIGYPLNGSVQKVSGGLYFKEKTDDRLSVQVQNWNTMWTRGYKLDFLMTEEGMVISNVFTKVTGSSKDAAGNTVYYNYLGDDLSENKPYLKESPLYPLDLTITMNGFPLEGRRIVFAGKTTLGGRALVSDGAYFVVAGKSVAEEGSDVLCIDADLQRGGLVFLDNGKFTHAGKLTGDTGRVIYTTSDCEPGTPAEVTFAGPLTKTDQVVAENVSLASVTGLTAICEYKYYNSDEIRTMQPAYQGDLRPAFFRNIGVETVARFQARDNAAALSFSGAVRFAQQGKDIVAKLVGYYSAWHSTSPTAADPWTWDVVNDNKSDDAMRAVDPSKLKATNLKLKLASSAEDWSRYADVTVANTDMTSNVTYIFRPGANCKLVATVKSLYGVPYYNGAMCVYDRATLSFDCTVSGSEEDERTANEAKFQGLWHQTGPGAATICVYGGGRAFTNCQRQNNGYGQTVVIDGGKYAFRPAEKDKGTLDDYRFTSSRSYVNGISVAEDNCVAGLTYMNGARTYGWDTYLGTMGSSPTLAVDGTSPSSAENNFALYGGKNESNWLTLTLNVADVTGDELPDFTMDGRLQAIHYAYARTVKKGAGTILFNRKHDLSAAKMRILDGAVLMGMTNGLGSAGVSLEGGALAIQAGLTNSITGPIALTANSTIKLAEGSKIIVDDSSEEMWASGARLDITGNPATSAICFGVNGLTATQLKQIRWGGKRVEFDEAGNLVPYSPGLVIFVQ